MPEPTHYALDVIHVRDILEKTRRNSALYVEVKFGKVLRKTVTLDGDGKPAWKGTLAFSLSDTSAVLAIQLKKNRKLGLANLLGRVGIKSEELLEETGRDFQRSLLSPPSRLFLQRRSEPSGIIHLHLEKIDALRSAEIEISFAEHGVEDIKNRLDRHLPVIEAIGLIVEAGDTILDAIDKVPGMTSIVALSWKSTSTLFKLVSDQYKSDKDLIDLVERMKTAFEFSEDLSSALDARGDLKPLLKQILYESVECSRFVQRYSKHSFLGRMGIGYRRPKIKDYKDRFLDLRGDLDTAILKKIVSQQDLAGSKEKLGPFTTMPDVSKRSRCLPGTRTKYLEQINGFLESKTSPNILWLTGAAGSGKSTIAVTVSFAHGYNTVHLFFERNKSEPSDVIRTIAYNLAERHPLVGKHIIKVVGESMNIIGDTLEKQFTKLLLEPLCKADIPNTIVIILDALDECGNAGSRQDLLHLLKTKFAQLPSKVRILITSRPEGDIMKDFPTNSHINHVRLMHADDETNDVALYIRKEMEEEFGDRVQEVAKEIQVLCQAADGLFIWASTAVKMVRGPIDPQENLQQLVGNIRTLGEHGLYSLYASALKNSGIWQSYSKNNGTAVLGLILVAKEAMTGAVIAAFLGLEERTVDRILQQLQSVVSYEAGKPVRLHHASFADYLLSSQRPDDKPWHIDERVWKQAVTERCFDVMAEKLHFNICDIESSFLRNSEIPKLDEHVMDKIPPYLDYACRFWAVHLYGLEWSDSLTNVRDKLKNFASAHLLYWLEVLSLTGCFIRVAGRSLHVASSWTTMIDAELSSFLWTAYRLVVVFEYPISQSAPHIYVSAISLWKGESLIADHFSKSHPVTKVDRLGIRTPVQCIKVLQGHTNWVHSVAVSADGERIASGSRDRTIRVWSAFSGELISGPFEADAWVTFVAFTPDGKQVMSGTRDGTSTIRIWDVGDTGSTSTSPVLNEVVSVPFSPDSRCVISISDGKLLFYSENGKLVTVRFEDDMDVVFREVTPDGKYVLGSKGSMIGIWDTGTGQRVSALFHVGDVYKLTVSPDGKLLATIPRSGNTCIWNVDSAGEVVKELCDGSAFSVSFSPDGKHVVSGGYEISIWDADSGQCIWGPFRGHTSPITSVIFTPDGKRVISGSEDCTIRIWDVGSTDITSGAFEAAHTKGVTSVAFSPDEKRIVSGSDDHTICIWDADSGDLLVGPFKGHSGWVHPVSFSPDGKRVLSGSQDGTIRIWNADSGELLAGPFEAHLDGPGCTRTSTGGSDGVFITERHGFPVTSVVFSPNGKHFASPSYDNTICIRDADTGRLVSGPFMGHTATINSVGYSPDGKRVVSGSYDRTVCIWDADSGKLVLDPLEGHTGAVRSVTFSSNGKRVASGSADRTICIWDAGTGELISEPLKGHRDTVESVCFSPDGKCVVSGSWDKTICIWDADSGELILGPLEGHTGPVQSVAISPSGTRIVSGSWDKAIRVWDVGGGGFVPGCSGRLARRTMETSSSSHRADTHTGSIVQGTSPDASRKRTLSNWTLSENGWVKGERGELLTWIPEDMRVALWRLRNTAFIGQFSMRLDLQNSPVGREWAKGYSK
ncbi:hypothetical protein ACEPAH_3811 [Sanghuangporus vaninii]